VLAPGFFQTDGGVLHAPNVTAIQSYCGLPCNCPLRSRRPIDQCTQALFQAALARIASASKIIFQELNLIVDFDRALKTSRKQNIAVFVR
jgi:hypothetical protein